MPTTFRSSLLFALLAILGGCAADSGSIAGEPREAAMLTLSEAGIGGLSGETEFSPEAVQAALPEGFAIETGQVLTERDTIPVLYAFAEGQIILEVYPDRERRQVARVDAASEQVAGPEGARPGAGFEDIGGRRMDCEPGIDELVGRALCSPSGGGPVRYVFAHGATTARGELPGRDVMAQSILERIVWMAP